MKLAVISFTERGSRLNRSVSELLSREGIEVESTALARYAGKRRAFSTDDFSS